MKAKCYICVTWAVVIFLSQLANSAFAQNADSLIKVIARHKADDTAKVGLYAQASMAYRHTSVDSMVNLARAGIHLSAKLGFDYGKAKCLVPLSVACLLKSELDTGMKYCDEAISIFEKASDSNAMSYPLFYKATIFYNQAKFKQSIDCYLRAVRYFHLARNYPLEANALNNMGNAYSTLGNYPEALNYFLKGLKLRENGLDTDEISVSLGNVAQVYADMGNRAKAYQYINRSIALMQQRGDAMGLMINYENAGGVYAAMEDHANAIKAFKNAIRIADSAHFVFLKSEMLVNLGEVYLSAGDYDNAFVTYKSCLDDTNLSANPTVEAMTYRGLGKILIHNKDYDKGANYLYHAQTVFKENELKRQYMENAMDLSEAYAGQGNCKLALAYRDTFYKYKDDLTSEKLNTKMQQLEFDYELQKKEDQIELLNKKKVIAQIRTIGLVFGIALLLVLIVFLYRVGRREKRSKEIIASQVAKLDELNKYKDMIFSVMSHDLRGPLNSLSVIMAMLNDNDITVGEFNELRIDIDKQLGSVTFLLDNLLTWSKNYMVSGKATKPDRVAIRPLADQNVQLVRSEAERKKVHVYNNVDTHIHALADASQVDIILRNLLSNALKFTPAEGSITISATESAERIRISIVDTGVGMTQQQIDKLFKATPDKSTYGTSGEKGIGLGLLLSYEFIIANNGTIEVASEVGKGSVFTVTLPKA